VLLSWQIVLEAQARPAPISIGFAAGAWLVGVPTAYYLGLGRASPSLLGIWLGMIGGYSVTSAIGFFFAFFRSEWSEQARKAVERSRIRKDELKDAETEPFLPK
jgi:MATE family multidrug resistance protein